MSKLKSVWDLAGQPIWTRSIGPLEVNAMLLALIGRGRIRAACDLYRGQFSTIDSHAFTTDAYSLSILFKGLTASISDEALHKDTVVSCLNSSRHNSPA